MDDIRKLILELTSSQRHEEVDVQTAAQVVSENESVRRDLGGSFGVEAGKGQYFVCLNPNQSCRKQKYFSNLFWTCSFRVI
jgi:hypothetical protein